MSQQEQIVPLPERRVAVWPHTLGEFEHFDDAVAVASANGVLTVWRWADRQRTVAVPVKIYAPGSWITVEHLGGGYAPTSQHSGARIPEAVPSLQEWAGGVPADEDEPATRSRQHDADPFTQLAPESLDEENSDVTSKTTTGSIPAKERPGEDGEDAAFRGSADSLPLPKPETADTTGQPDGTGEGVAQRARDGAVRASRAARRWLGWLSRQLSTLDPLSPTHPRLPQLRPHWYISSPALTALVFTLVPAMLYLSFSAN